MGHPHTATIWRKHRRCRPHLIALALSALHPLGGPAIAGSRTADAGIDVVSDLSEAFVISEKQYRLMFPNRLPGYSYQSLVQAARLFPSAFSASDEVVRKQEAAAFFANVHHETGGLEITREADQANWSLYFDPASPYVPGQLYYGRGPIQLSWNYNYHAAGEALGLDLLSHPDLVADDPAVGWATALWFWTTQAGAGSMTPHEAMTRLEGFAETIRSINGTLECGKPDGDLNHARMLHRVELYRRFTTLLGVPTGNNLKC
jgi:predicted chitinase